MLPVARLQAFLRRSAQHQYTAVAIPPFSAFFHADDPLSFLNYAIPDEPAGGDLRAPLARLRAEFRARGRLPRFEFIEGYAPALAAALRVAGFAEESRLHLMLCLPATYCPAPDVPGLTVARLTPDAPDCDIEDFLETRRAGFEPFGAPALAPDEAARFRAGLSGGGATFLARLHGHAAGVASHNTPLDGTTEIGGVATLAAFRRRGIAAAITGEAVRTAFADGAEAAILTAGDERAGRVYERVGFRPYATMLAYRDADEPAPAADA